MEFYLDMREMSRFAVGLRLIKENGSCEVIICVECVKGEDREAAGSLVRNFLFCF